MPPQDLLVFLLGAANPNRRPCPLEPTRGQLSPCGAWPDWARASCFPQPCAPSFRAHSDGRRAGTVDGHHPQHSGVSLRPPTYDLRVDATELVSTWVVGHLWTLFPVPLCPMCAQMSTNAASRTGGATKYATTSRAASTAPATAATRSPPTAGPAKVRPRMQACPGLSPRLPVALLPAPPHFYFCSCQIAEVGSHICSAGSGCLLWFWRGGKKGGGVFCRRSTCLGMSVATGSCPSTASTQGDSPCRWSRLARRRRRSSCPGRGCGCWASF